MIGKSFERGKHADEYRVSFGVRPPMLKVVDNSLADFLRQRQQRLSSVLASDSNRGSLPIDVAEAQTRHVAGAQTQARQQQHNCAVPFTFRRCWIA